VAQCFPAQTAAQGCTGTPTRQNLTGTRAIQAPQLKFSIAHLLQHMDQMLWTQQIAIIVASAHET